MFITYNTNVHIRTYKIIILCLLAPTNVYDPTPSPMFAHERSYERTQTSVGVFVRTDKK